MIGLNENYKLVKDLLSKNTGAYVDIQEYMRYANLAQNELFDTLRGNNSQNKSTYGRNRTLDARLNPFRVKEDIVFASLVATKPTGMAQITAIYSTTYVPIRPIDEDRIANIVQDPLSESHYYAEDATQLRLVKGADVSGTIEYLKLPTPVDLKYTIVNGRSVYNATGTINFEWDKNMEMELTTRILSYAALSMGNQLVMQAANNNKAQE